MSILLLIKNNNYLLNCFKIFKYASMHKLFFQQCDYGDPNKDNKLGHKSLIIGDKNGI